MTRNRLLQLFHQANNADKADDLEAATRLFGEIVEAVPQLPEPYEALARIYDRHRDESRGNLETAIFFYRKYIDIQLEDSRVAEATQRLRELEAEIGASHYDEQLAEDIKAMEQEYEVFGRAVEMEMAEEANESAPAIGTKPTGGALLSSEENMERVNSCGIAGDDVLTELLSPLVVNPLRKKSVVMAQSQINPQELAGRWVSYSRLANNREVWILDIQYEHDEIRITLNSNSGILQVPQWRQGGLFERTSLLAMANSGNVVTTRDDITLETMRMFNNIKSTVASGMVDNNGRLVFNYNIDLNYVPTAGKYDGTRALISGLGSAFSAVGGFLGAFGKIGTSLVESAVDNAEASDTQIRYNGEINFLLGLTPSGLVGSGRELIVEESDKGEHEKKNRVFTTSFFRVSKHYQGYPVEDGRRKKSQDEIKEEKKILSQIKSEAKTDSRKQYLLAILYGYMVGEDKTEVERTAALKSMTGNLSNNKLLKQMTKAAKNGSLDAIDYLIRWGYDVAANPDARKSARKKGLEMAEEWSGKIKFTSPAMVAAAEAEYLIKTRSDYDKAFSIYRGVEYTENPIVLNRIGELYQFNYDDVVSAIDYYIRAAKTGSAHAMLNIARLYRDGIGVEENAEEYLNWTSEAYRKGSLDASDELAYAYTYGIGVEPDVNMANKYVEALSKRKKEYWREIMVRFR